MAQDDYTMADLAADPVYGKLLPSQSVIDSVLNAKHEHWHFAVAFVIYLGVDLM